MNKYIKNTILNLINLKYRFRLGDIGKNSFIREKCIIKNPKYVFVGDNSLISPNSEIYCYKEYFTEKLNPKLIIGNNVFINKGFRCLVACNIRIGDFCSFGNNVFITSENHGNNPEAESYLRQKLICKDVIIQNNCWIGENVNILPGVNIGSHCIIGCNSVVTHDIPAYVIAVGNPARVIKRWDFDKKCWINVK